MTFSLLQMLLLQMEASSKILSLPLGPHMGPGWGTASNSPSSAHGEVGDYDCMGAQRDKTLTSQRSPSLPHFNPDSTLGRMVTVVHHVKARCCRDLAYIVLLSWKGERKRINLTEGDMQGKRRAN